MREKLEKLLNNSYAKYSNFRVACICVMNDGNEISGVNVENASYGATICAERVAITGAIAKGYKKGDFKELHIMVDSDKIGTPCFMCRQVIKFTYIVETIWNHLKYQSYVHIHLMRIIYEKWHGKYCWSS